MTTVFHADTTRLGWDRHFWSLTAFAGALLALSLLVMAVDTRTLGGVNVWMKPVKFALSFPVFFATLALAAERLSDTWRTGRLLAVVTIGCMAAFSFEMGYMMTQSAQGAASHFNVSTPFHSAMYGLMGLGALWLTGSVAAIGVAVARDDGVRMTPRLRLGVVTGFAASFVLTVIVAGYMSNTGGHHVGLHPEGGAVLPLLGWSLVVGDLRPSHFLSLHAMQALPLLGWIADRKGWSARPVLIGLAGYTVLTIGLFVQALAGLPILPV